MTRIEDKFIDLIADDGMEFWNGEIVTNRITAPLGTDLSQWIERIIEPKIEDMTLDELLLLEQELLNEIE